MVTGLLVVPLPLVDLAEEVQHAGLTVSTFPADDAAPGLGDGDRGLPRTVPADRG